MSISYDVLGEPGRDNALLASVNTGQSQHRLLFDCGEACLNGVSRADIQTIEVLFFSHFHIDHIAGFDSFFRSNWYRSDGPVRIFGPEGTRRIIHHRMRGYTWNLVGGQTGEVHVTELKGEELHTSRYLACEGFEQERELDQQRFGGLAYRGNGFRVEARALHHGTTSLAYVVREDDRSNIDMEALNNAGWRSGPWLKQVKDSSIPAEQEVAIDGANHKLRDLRERLLVWQPGDSLAYLTDFCLESQQSEDALVEFLKGCKVLICENNFRDADAVLSRNSFHMTSSDVGRLAARVDPERLVLFHVSDRYTEEEWNEQLAEVREQFDRVEFPTRWNLSR